MNEVIDLSLNRAGTERKSSYFKFDEQDVPYCSFPLSNTHLNYVFLSLPALFFILIGKVGIGH